MIECRTIPSEFSSCSYLSILSMSSPLLSIPKEACNSESLTIFDLSAFKLLQSIEIGNENMYHTNSLLIDNIIQLKTIRIGSNSFTKHKNSYGKDDSRSFKISNCDKLESIEIDQYSFSDYSGKFELINIPSLKSLKIGIIGKTSSNFYYGSLTIQGIIILSIINDILDLPNLITIELGDYTFGWSNLVDIESIIDNNHIIDQ